MNIELPSAYPSDFPEFSTDVLIPLYAAETGTTCGEYRRAGTSYPFDFKILREAFERKDPEAIKIAKLFLVWRAKRRLTS